MKVKTNLTRIAALVLAAALLTFALPFSGTSALAAQSNWYDSVVADFASRGYFNDTVDFESPIEVDEFVQLAVYTGSYKHADGAFEVAFEKGWIAEYPDAQGVDEPLTRGQAAGIAVRMLSGEPSANPASDAAALGIMVGDGKGNLRANDYITYAEAMKLLTNVEEVRNEQIDDSPVKKLSVEEVFSTPTGGFSMSEDGEYLYYAGIYENRLNVFRQNPYGGEPERLTNITDKSIVAYFLKDNYLIYMADNGGDENYHLFSVELGGELTETDITPYDGVMVQPINILDNIENEILVMMNKNNPQVFDVYKLNVATGELTLVEENSGSIQGWLTDWDGNVRIAYVSDSIDTYIMYRAGGEGEFGLLAQATNADTLQPLAFSKDGTLLYLLSNVNRNTTSLISLDLTTGEETLVYANEKYDIAGANLSDDGSKVTSVSYYADKAKVLFFDEETEALARHIFDRFGTENLSAQTNEEKTRALVAVSSDTSPSAYYYYNLENEDIIPLGSSMPWLDSSTLCEMIPVSYTARDGLVIHGYLTLPKNTVPENLPLVVNPHGGPWARDYWGFNPEVQLLANQGYAVLQMNFRGSTGYGKEFVYAGDRQWGRAMQDDITDGVNWLVKIGVVDSEKIAIYGGSYGGYAVLSGITQTPDLYAAAIDYVGVSNLLTFLETIPPYWEGQRNYLYDRIGDPVEDYEYLYDYSPVNHADKITTPLFVAQGANDPRVNKAESDQIVEALRARGIDVDYMVKENEGHGFVLPENRYDFYTAMVEFLAKYLGE